MNVFQNLFKDNNSLKNNVLKSKFTHRIRFKETVNCDPYIHYIFRKIRRRKHHTMKIFTGARLYESLNDISDICDITEFKYISEYTDDLYFWKDRLL